MCASCVCLCVTLSLRRQLESFRGADVYCSSCFSPFFLFRPSPASCQRHVRCRGGLPHQEPAHRPQAGPSCAAAVAQALVCPCKGNLHFIPADTSSAPSLNHPSPPLSSSSRSTATTFSSGGRTRRRRPRRARHRFETMWYVFLMEMEED